MPMLRIATWNINSVRLRRPLLAELISALDPDVLCLQETKCPDELFPLDDIRAMGFPHIAHKGMKGYNGVAVLSRRPLQVLDGDPDWCGKGDCRHLAVAVDAPGGPIELHDFYVPAGGDTPDREANVKFAHKLDFVAEATAWSEARGAKARSVLVGDLNIAPLEHDVWSHRQMIGVVSHTPVECEKLIAAQRSGGWVDCMRIHTPEPEKLYTWWSYRAMDNWRNADRGRRLDHVWTSDALADRVSAIRIAKDYRGAKRPSDHVPVTA